MKKGGPFSRKGPLSCTREGSPAGQEGPLFSDIVICKLDRLSRNVAFVFAGSISNVSATVIRRYIENQKRRRR